MTFQSNSVRSKEGGEGGGGKGEKGGKRRGYQPQSLPVPSPSGLEKKGEGKRERESLRTFSSLSKKARISTARGEEGGGRGKRGTGVSLVPSLLRRGGGGRRGGKGKGRCRSGGLLAISSLPNKEEDRKTERKKIRLKMAPRPLSPSARKKGKRAGGRPSSSGLTVCREKRGKEKRGEPELALYGPSHVRKRGEEKKEEGGEVR